MIRALASTPWPARERSAGRTERGAARRARRGWRAAGDGRVMDGLRRRLLVVEDEPLLAALMGRALEDAGFDVRVCADELSAREAVTEFDPDAALIDVHLASGPSGLYLAHVLARAHPAVGILLMSRHEDLSAAGLEGWDLPAGSRFLTKDRLTDADVLVAAVESVLRGTAATDPGADVGAVAGAGSLAGLTSTQLSVLRQAAMGLTNTAIAERRGTSERNIEQRLQAVYASLGIPVDGEVNPRVEAVRRYVVAAGVPSDLGPLGDLDDAADADGEADVDDGARRDGGTSVDGDSGPDGDASTGDGRGA